MVLTCEIVSGANVFKEVGCLRSEVGKALEENKSEVRCQKTMRGEEINL
jgi:hypothetical protein